MNNYTYSRTGLHLTEQFEGCRLTAYQDSGGIWTCGYGHTAGVDASTTCTQEQAEIWLQEDVQSAANIVNKCVSVPLTQGEFDALVDLTFNIGGGNFRHSTMLALLNQSDYNGAASQFERWDKVGGQVIAGLLRRRLAEKEEFLNGQ